MWLFPKSKFCYADFPKAPCEKNLDTNYCPLTNVKASFLQQAC